jgi:hypothetical protein
MLQQSSILSLKPEPLGPIKAARFKVIDNESKEEATRRLEIWKVNQGLILQQRNEKSSKHTKDMERFDLLPTHSIISCRLIMAFMSPQARNVLLAVYPMISHYLQKSEVFQLYGEVLSAINSYSPSIQLHAFRSINNLAKITMNNGHNDKSIHELKTFVVDSITNVIDTMASLLLTKEDGSNDKDHDVLAEAANLLSTTFTQRAMNSDNNNDNLSRVITYFTFHLMDDSFKKGFTIKNFDGEIEQGISCNNIPSLLKRINISQLNPKTPKSNPSNNSAIVKGNGHGRATTGPRRDRMYNNPPPKVTKRNKREEDKPSNSKKRKNNYNDDAGSESDNSSDGEKSNNHSEDEVSNKSNDDKNNNKRSRWDVKNKAGNNNNNNNNNTNDKNRKSKNNPKPNNNITNKNRNNNKSNDKVRSNFFSTTQGYNDDSPYDLDAEARKMFSPY